MNKHIKNCLSSKKQDIDPSRIQEFGENVDIRRNLESMSLKRPDIFGVQKSKEVKEENSQGEKVVWDGQNPNITRTTGSIAMLANEQKKIKGIIKEGKNS